MQLYFGYQLLEILHPNQKASCVEGLYIGYVVQKFMYGNQLIWANDEVVELNGGNDPFFRYSKWKKIIDQDSQT
jgi:hypothetical protein